MRWLRSNSTGSAGLLRKREHGQLTAEGGVVVQCRIATDRPKTCRRIGEACCKPNAGPASDTRKDSDVLLALVGVRHHVPDDAGRGLEFVEFLAGLCAHRLQVALERAVTRCRPPSRARPPTPRTAPCPTRRFSPRGRPRR